MSLRRLSKNNKSGRPLKRGWIWVYPEQQFLLHSFGPFSAFCWRWIKALDCTRYTSHNIALSDKEFILRLLGVNFFCGRWFHNHISLCGIYWTDRGHIHVALAIPDTVIHKWFINFIRTNGLTRLGLSRYFSSSWSWFPEEAHSFGDLRGNGREIFCDTGAGDNV